MVHITVKRGLDIPIVGEASGAVQRLDMPKQIALDLSHFVDTRFHLLVQPGAEVRIGQPIAEDKDLPGRFFVAPAAGKISECRRGEKRRLTAMVIDVAEKEEWIRHEGTSLERLSPEELKELLCRAGLFAQIRCRPFNRLAKPSQTPRSIFVKAIESAPLLPSAELQVQGHEEAFQLGLNALQKLTTGPVHLIYREGTSCRAFAEATRVQKHTISGPHPAGNVSVHIHHIDPIKKADELVWTLNVLDVISIGTLLSEGHIAIDRIVSIAGPALLEDKRQFVSARMGFPIGALVQGRVASKKPVRLISGDPLMGQKVEEGDFLGFDHTEVCVLEEAEGREPLHFFRLGGNKFTASGAYLSHFLNPKTHRWNFTTSEHGEHRAFVDGSVYERVVPMQVLPMQMVRALQADDFELAEELGLLEVDSEDFALPAFVCPCKIEMVEIIRSGLRQYAKDLLG